MAVKEITKRSTMDKLAALAGVGAGVAGASAIGTAVGGAGLLGTIGSAVGLTVAVATPVGWLVGGAALGAAALYGGSTLVGAKGVSDGDAKAYRQFNSDFEKQAYMKITAKLSQKDIVVARKLLEKIPLDFKDWKESAINGLATDSMPATDIITMCCELLNEETGKYLDNNNFSITEVELTIKFAILMALSDGQITDDEIVLIRKEVVSYFELSKIFDDAEINLIFSQAKGTEEQQEQLEKTSFEEIQSLFAVFFLSINNNRLKMMLPDFLTEIARADGEISDNEVILYNIFIGLLNAEEELDNYLPHLETLTKIKSDMLFSHKGIDTAKYTKKVNNALGSYASGIPIESIFSLYDATIFGKANEGFIVTPLAIITDQAADIRVIPLGSIYHVALENDKGGDILLYGEQDENGDMELIASLGCLSHEIIEFISFLKNIVEVNVGVDISSYNTIEEWHLAQNGNQLGLHSLDSINSKFADSDLSENELLAWKDGMPEWLLATEIDEINSIIEKYKVTIPAPLPSSPPPLPS